MTIHTDLVAQTQQHLAAAAPAAATDPHVAALCGLAAAILVSRPSVFRSDLPPGVDLERFLADTADDTSPAATAARAVVTAVHAAHIELDDLAVDDCGFPIHA